MRKNVGTADRFIRAIAATVIALLFVTDVIKGTLGVVLGFVAILLLFTSALNFCPLYLILGLSTKRPAPAKEAPKPK